MVGVGIFLSKTLVRLDLCWIFEWLLQSFVDGLCYVEIFVTAILDDRERVQRLYYVVGL
jgi:hypothetical protein